LGRLAPAKADARPQRRRVCLCLPLFLVRLGAGLDISCHQNGRSQKLMACHQNGRSQKLMACHQNGRSQKLMACHQNGRSQKLMACDSARYRSDLPITGSEIASPINYLVESAAGRPSAIPMGRCAVPECSLPPGWDWCTWDTPLSPPRFDRRLAGCRTSNSHRPMSPGG